MSCDREAEPKPGCGPADHRFRLTEPVEHVRQELWTDSSSGIADRELSFGIGEFHLDLNNSCRGRELDCIG